MPGWLASVVSSAGCRASISSLAHPVRHVREGDQAEVAGGQHDRLRAPRRGRCCLVALLDRPAQRRPHGGAGLGAAVGALRPCAARAARSRPGPGPRG